MNSYGLSYLVSVWQSGGTRRLKQTFSSLALRDRQDALHQINDERLRFPVLFILMDEIGAQKMYTELSKRNLTALNICSRKIYKHDIEDTSADSGNLHKTLKWMFDTGREWEGPSEGHDPYDSVIDYATALLITAYEDKSVLKDVAGLIFRRNRQGLYIHDLVWSFFQALDRDALAIIGGYLLSNNPRDVELASQLLGLDETCPMNRNRAQKENKKFIEWLDDNRPYLYLTGEQFQMTSNPRHLDADNEAKYLGKEISPRYRTPVEPLTEEETECLHRYREAKPEDRVLLTDYSSRLRGKDKLLWQEWMRKKPAEQVAAARTTREAI